MHPESIAHRPASALFAAHGYQVSTTYASDMGVCRKVNVENSESLIARLLDAAPVHQRLLRAARAEGVLSFEAGIAGPYVRLQAGATKEARAAATHLEQVMIEEVESLGRLLTAALDTLAGQKVKQFHRQWARKHWRVVCVCDHYARMPGLEDSLHPWARMERAARSKLRWGRMTATVEQRIGHKWIGVAQLRGEDFTAQHADGVQAEARRIARAAIARARQMPTGAKRYMGSVPGEPLAPARLMSRCWHRAQATGEVEAAAVRLFSAPEDGGLEVRIAHCDGTTTRMLTSAFDWQDALDGYEQECARMATEGWSQWGEERREVTDALFEAHEAFYLAAAEREAAHTYGAKRA